MAVSSIPVSILGIVSLFAASCLGFYMLILSFTSQVGDKVSLRFPYNLDLLKALIADLKSVKDDHFISIVYLFSAAYLLKQSFGIPGSFALNILAGAIFGPWVGLPLVCVLTASGATCSFLISKMFGHAIVEACLKERIAPIKKMVSGDGDATSEFLLLISLRLFPNTPNWLLNLSSPHLGVSITQFFFSVLIGLMPYNFLCVQAGGFLQFSSLSDALDSKTLAGLAVVSVTILLLVILTRRRKTKNE